MIDPIIEQANAAFPNINLRLEGQQQRFVTSRNIGRYGLALFCSPGTLVEVIGSRAVSAGFGNRFKLIWQISGRMEFEGTRNRIDIGPGELLVTSMAADYQLKLLESHEALILTFDPIDHPMWSELAREALARPISKQSGISASAQGVRALLSAPIDSTSELAARTMINLALLSTQRTDCDASSSHLKARAALYIKRNLCDIAYSPARLARDLGMSRRRLYTRLAAAGTTPATLISQIRLSEAKENILREPAVGLLEIALANGFRDGACLSRAFRNVYGYPPSWLRRQRQV
jgi:AraC-like DNA-binding protein